MKHYDAKQIKDYIEYNKKTLKSLTLGMKEDWGWTSLTIYENREMLSTNGWDSEGGYDEICSLEGETIKIRGITGSTWATPIMVARFKNGNEDEINCFYDDEIEDDPQLVARQMKFAKDTDWMGMGKI